jgi:hypothetical protein
VKVTHLAPSQYLKQPWKNGGGTTTELAAHAEGARFLWRVSIADVDRSGPFSDFSGYERTLMMLEGKGMQLTFDAAPGARIERRLRPFVFQGEWKTGCDLLDGPVKDFNLMVDRTRATGSLEVLELTKAGRDRGPLADTELLYCVEGVAELEGAGIRAALHPGESVRIDGAPGCPLRLECRDGKAILAAIRIQLRPPAEARS